jgi:hypothetical protein
MITVFGEGRGFRVVWLLEAMGIPYRLRPVDLLAGVEKDAEFLAVNPAGFIPAIQDGNVGIGIGIGSGCKYLQISGRLFKRRANLVTKSRCYCARKLRPSIGCGLGCFPTGVAASSTSALLGNGCCSSGSALGISLCAV